MKIPPKVDVTLITSESVDEQVILAAAARAETLIACGQGFALTDANAEAFAPGAEFEIDLLVPEEWETGDGRTFSADSLTSRDFPITLYWQEKTASGHDGAVIVGRIDYAERLDSVADDASRAVVFLEDGTEVEGTTEPPKRGWGRARGVFDNGVWGREAERLVRNGFLRGVSVDLDKFKATVVQHEEAELSEGDLDDLLDEPQEETIESEKIDIKQARIIAATLTGKPAFQECAIRIVEPEVIVEDIVILDGEYEEESDDLADALAVMTASAVPVVPPREWFNDPKLTKETALTVEDDGKVFGHIATWEMTHIGMLGKSLRPPRSQSDYAYFKTGVVRTDDGSDVRVGQLTLTGGHANLNLNAREAMSHYDDTASAVVDVTIGEDQYGIWVAGALRPEVTASQIRALRASATSGDWRPIKGRLELVAACCVNVPGFPIVRTMVAGGQLQALVAAGSRTLAELRDPVRDFEARISAMERKEFAARIETLAHMKDAVREHDAALLASATAARRKVLGPSLEEQRSAIRNRIVLD